MVAERGTIRSFLPVAGRSPFRSKALPNQLSGHQRVGEGVLVVARMIRQPEHHRLVFFHRREISRVRGVGTRLAASGVRGATSSRGAVRSLGAVRERPPLPVSASVCEWGRPAPNRVSRRRRGGVP